MPVFVHPVLVADLNELYRAVLASPHPADRVAAGFLRSRRRLGRRDRTFIADHLFDLLRGFRPLERRLRLAGIEPTPEAQVALLLAERGFDPWAGVPSVAGQRQTIERLAAEGGLDLPPVDPVEAVAVGSSLPDWLAAALVERLGPVEAAACARSLRARAPFSVRINRLRCTRAEALERLAAEGIPAEPALLAPDGIRLGRRIDLTRTAVWREGLVEVQDEGAQLAGMAAAPEPGSIVVDLCAGGGGKTLLLASLMGDRGELYAFDANVDRLQPLHERLARAGAGSVRVMDRPRKAERAQERLAGRADLVLVDAPCTGTGTVRRSPDLPLKLSPDDPGRFAERQRHIMATAAGLVRPGGRLVYVTCSLLRQEDEDVIAGFLVSHPGFVPVEAAAGLPDDARARMAGCWLLLPHRHDTDGFFIAVLRREGGGDTPAAPAAGGGA